MRGSCTCPHCGGTSVYSVERALWICGEKTCALERSHPEMIVDHVAIGAETVEARRQAHANNTRSSP